jgi:hypothetical protein
MQEPTAPTDSADAAVAVAENDSTGSKAVLVTGSHLGFCYQYSAPGQYCLAGTPEAGIICPQGIRVLCRRSRTNSIDDLSGEMERCVQQFGQIPLAEQTAQDPFRRHPVVDVLGNALSNGWFASCERLL